MADYGPPILNWDKFDPFKSFQEGRALRNQDQLQEGLKGLPKGPDGSIDWGTAAAKALELGNVDAAAKFSQLATTTADKSFERDYKTQMLGLEGRKVTATEQQANRREVPDKIKILRESGINPNSPEGRQALFKLDEKLGSADKKAIFEAEDDNAKLDSTVAALKDAKKINSQTYSGAFAGKRTALGANLPDWMVPDFIAEPKKSEIGVEWEKSMTPEAIQRMANTLKGATTDFELREFVKLLSNLTTPAKVREQVIDRMLQLSERQREINQTRMDQLRGGTYYKPQGGQSGARAKQIGSKAEYDALPSGTPYIAPDGSTRTKQ